MAIKIKGGVEPPSLTLMAALMNTWENFQLLPGTPKDLVVTSGRDGTHMTGSRHYDHAALDVRSKTFADRDLKRLFLRTVISRLGRAVVVETPTGPGYQTADGRWLGILEYEGRTREHFHLERN